MHRDGTYSASETPDWKANAFSAAMYSGGIRAPRSLVSKVERLLGWRVVADDQLFECGTLATDDL
jgi:hypothetical protein